MARPRYDRTHAPRPPMTALVRYVGALRAHLEPFLERVEREALAGYVPQLWRRKDALEDIAIEPFPYDDIVRVTHEVNEHATAEMRRVFSAKGEYLGKGLVASPGQRLVSIFLATAAPVAHASLPTFRKTNVELITSIQRGLLGEMTSLLDDARSQGLHSDELRKLIRERFEVTKSKADLLARDQILKLNADITETRQRSAGIDRYRWSTSKDERVRHFHRQLEGTVQFWTAPPVTDRRGARNHPGKDYQCRCVAVPMLPGIDYPDPSG